MSLGALDFGLIVDGAVIIVEAVMHVLAGKHAHGWAAYTQGEMDDITEKSAFFFGVEKAGLSKDVMDNADGFLKIPMVGFTESLNISVAAAIILQNLTEK